jgi:uncharacterized membrane protein
MARGPARPGKRFTSRRRRVRAGLSQLLLAAIGLAAGILVPKITLHPLLASGRIVDLLLGAGVTVISLVTVIYSLLFLVVQWVAGNFSPRLALFRDDPIVWRAFAYAIGVFVFCFTSAFAIGNDKKVSLVVPAVALVLVLAALALMRTLQTRALTSVLLAPTLAAVSDSGREILEELYLPSPAGAEPAASLPSLPPLRHTVTWAGRPAVLQQLDVGPLLASARAVGSVVVFRQSVGVTLVAGMPIADVHGGDLAPSEVLAAVVTGLERSFDQDPLLAFRLLADIGLRALSPAINDPATASQVVDCLEGLLGPLAGRTAVAGQVADHDGHTRVVLKLPGWDEFARGCLDDLIAAAGGSPLVLLRIRDLTTRLRGLASAPGQAVLLARQRWTEDTLARNFPVIWAGLAPAGGSAGCSAGGSAGSGPAVAGRPELPHPARVRKSRRVWSSLVRGRQARDLPQ